MLGGSLADIRAQATLALGKIGDPEDIPDEFWPVRAQVASSLGMIGELSTIPTLQRLTVQRVRRPPR